MTSDDRFKRYGPRVDREMVEALKRIEEKWQERWRKDRVFEADPDPSKPKYFITFPYPYVNGLPHLGSAFTVLRVDIMARYKRMRGYNVLFPQGWHATGSPIVAAALRVRERDPKILRDLRMMGVPEEEIPRFENPEYWVYYFTKQWRKDFERYGLSIDWRREFYTTRLNPSYNRFVEWQYLRLRDKGLVVKGSHPVVWCPREKKVVGDHDRLSGYEGISPVEAYIIKFPAENGLILPALTMRPETVFGVTNIWVNPYYEYRIALVDGEKWVLTEYAAEELADQDHEVKVVGTIKGSELVGLEATNPATGEKIPVLPALFVKTGIGTGIVMSVPAHAPYDYAALRDLQENPGELAKLVPPSLQEKIKKIKPVKIIDVPGHQGLLVEEILRKLGVRSQKDEELLEKATREIYSKEYYHGVMAENTGEWAGTPVREAKEKIVEKLAEKNMALRVYTLPREVYCRCGAKTHVKIVKNQWFLAYSRPDWKKKARNALENIKLYPETARPGFEKAIEELRDWAFTHQRELGTPLPWDPEWVIESLSDSTIYMAYYTVAKYLQHPEKYGIKPEQLEPEVFDYIFLGKGSPHEIAEKTGIPAQLLEEMRREFTYWYPVDMRISGKDLIPNHLVFYIYHHTALFPEEHWPRGIGVNGWVLLEGNRMSKSLGVFILLREALDWWGADATRWAEVMGGADASLDDANFEPRQADAAVIEINNWLRFIREAASRDYREEWIPVDTWFQSILHDTIAKVTELMENHLFRSALVEAYYNLQSKYRWYLRRTGNNPNGKLVREYIETQVRLLAPFIPHAAEEAWEALGGKGYVSLAEWPKPDPSKIDRDTIRAEETLKTLLDDIEEVIKLKGKPRKIHITIAAEWKYRLFNRARELAKQGADLRKAISTAAKEAEAPREQVGKTIKTLMKNPSLLERYAPREKELETIASSTDFIKREIGVEEVKVDTEEESGNPRRQNALPGKPAIYLEY